MYFQSCPVTTGDITIGIRNIVRKLDFLTNLLSIRIKAIPNPIKNSSVTVPATKYIVFLNTNPNDGLENTRI